MDSKPERKWMAVYTKPRNEKTVNDRLISIGIETYLPLQEVVRQWSDRKKKVKIPLFTSYVFVRVNEKQRNDVLKDYGVLNFVFWLGKPAIIQDHEIERIRYFLKEAGTDEIVVEQLQPGDKALINSGQFKDEKVLVLSSEKKEYFVILESLGVRLRVSKLDVERAKM